MIIRPDTDDLTLASYGFKTAQAALSAPVDPSTRRVALCGWHTTMLDPERGSLAIVRGDGPLADWVGERLCVGYGGRSVLVYVHNEGDMDDCDISLYRRAFFAVAPLAFEIVTVSLQVAHGA